MNNSLTKTHKNSFFIKCDVNSNISDKLFSVSPMYCSPNVLYDVVVLQVMKIENSMLIFELVKLREYEVN